MSDTILRVQKLDLDQAATLIELPLLPYVVRLSPGSDHGFVRQWQLPGSDEARHLGYAFQWFALATMLIVIYLVLNLKRKSPDND